MVSGNITVSCVLDTDVVIDYLRGRQYARELLNLWRETGALSISVISHLEVYQGMRPGEEERTNALLDSMISFGVDVYLARLAGGLMGDFRRQGVTVSTGDAIIGATALRYGIPLITNNVDDYPFAGLTVVRGMSAT